MDASEQMRKRPMAPLLSSLKELGCEITCKREDGHFPFILTAHGFGQNHISIDIGHSSQFLSALLMTAPIQFDELEIQLTGTRSALSYVKMTEQMMKQFGHAGVIREADDRYRVIAQGGYHARDYMVEPDVSAACYFYAMAAVTGGECLVRNMRQDSLQGDMKFLQVLEQMGCQLSWGEKGLVLTGPEPGHLKGIEVDMSDFSDQTLTLAAIAPYADSPVHIRNVGHIRGQECDRLHAICENLGRMNVRCEEYEDGVKIYPGMPQPAEIETYQDHRVAMAFAVTGVRADGIVISDPMCCRKTFENYFEVLDDLTKR